MDRKDDIDRTLERSNKLDSMWQEIEQKLAEYEADKAEFAREHGVEFADYLSYFSGQAKAASQNSDEATRQDLERERQRVQEELESEFAQAESRHAAEKQLNRNAGGIKTRRLRNRI